MLADFWSSTQRSQWQFTRETLAASRQKVLLMEKKMAERGEVVQATISYNTHMRIYLHLLVLKLGRRTGVRQIAIATAQVYVTRFLTQASIKETNPYLLVTTCLYLACKIEECSQHIRLMVNEARNLWPEYVPHDATKVAEFEFYLIQELNSYMILHHPYRALLQINEALKTHELLQMQEGGCEALVLGPTELQNAWSILNDSYITDLHLLYPPHVTAMAAVFMTVVLQQESPNPHSTDPSNIFVELSHPLAQSNTLNPFTGKPEATAIVGLAERVTRFTEWLGTTNVDLEEMIAAIQELIVLYSMWEHYDEAGIKRSLNAILLGRA